MTTELIKALLCIFSVCVSADDCHNCVLRDFCGKMPSDWC